ncbi:hypothetical protein KRP22_004426 [Phytophthora ramorum]|nr:Titin [Phytophthora ramorum]
METVRQGSAGFVYDIFFLDYKATPYVKTLSLKHADNPADPVCSVVKQTGGSVRKVSVEMVELGGSSERQIVNVLDTRVTGAYEIELGSQSSSCLAFNAAASDVAAALVGLTSGSAGDVLVSSDTDFIESPNGFIYTITFVGDSVTGNIPSLVAVQSSDAACANAVATTNIVVESLVDGGAVSGEFALTMPYDGEAPNTPHVAYTMSQQFSVVDEQFEIQQLIISNPSNNIAASAKYTLTVLGVNTVSIPWNASESDLQDALTIPSKVNDGDIVVTRRTNSGVAPHGFIYTIYFSGPSVSGDKDAIQAVTATAPDIGPANVLVSTLRDGVVNAATLTTSSIPLALPNDPKTASQFLSSTAEQKLEIYKVNGYLWTIKFKSSLGNIPKLGKQIAALSGGAITIFDDFIPGSAANSFVIPGLLAGINYHVHVAALTDIGIGAFTPSASIEPSGSALAVQNIDAGYALYEREVQEIRLAASHITEIQEITTEAASIPEVQTLQTYASPELCPTGACITGSFAFRVPTVQTVTISADAAITGTFTLLFEREVSDNAGAFTKIGAVTAAINWDADAGTVKDKLTTVANSALAATDIVVTRDGDASPEFGYGYVFQVTFIGNSVAGETLSMACTPSFTTVGNVASRCSVAMNTNMAMGTDTMVQEVIVTAEKPLVVGSYKLGFDHLGLEKDTACIPFDASADDMKTKLEELPNIDHVFVTREAYADKAAIGFVYRIFFHGNGVRTAVNKLEGKSTGCSNFQTQENNVLTEVGVVGTVETSIVDKGGFDAGNTFVAAAANAVTSTAAQLSTDLNRLPIFGNVLVTRSLVDDQGGCIWTVAFEESEGNLPQFICAVDANFKAGTVCKTDTLTDGNVLSGSFFIGASSPIPFNADAAQIENELEAMGDINTVQVKRSAPSPQFGYTWTVTFVDYDGDAPPLLVTSSLVGTGSRISVREVRKGNALKTAAKSTSDGSSLQEKLEALDVVGRVSVQRSGPGHEGGYSWLVTFLDNVLNSGDLPLLQGNASMLTGEGAVVFTREVTKGSNAVGDQLWLSFDPPASDNGSPITKYQVRWDTSSKFTANPAEVFITDADVLYRTQRITTSAPSLAWSSNMIQPTASAVQKLTILAAGTFTLKFRGVDTTTLTAGPTGASTIATLESALEQLSSVGSVDISSAATTLAVTAEFQITFTAQPGALPLLVPDSNTIASVGEVQAGTTNFRKEIVVFSCTATKGTVKFTYKGEDDDTIKFDAKLADVEAELLAFIGVEADSISVSSVPAQTMLCSTANPADIIIVFHRVYGDISLGIAQGTTDSDAVITPNTAASIDGVYNDNPALTMSGTLQVGYQGLYTRPFNAESSADQLRYALEDLDTIQTVGVARDRSYQALSGKVDVTEGEIFVTCSAGETCNFYSAAYGLPGYFIRVGGDWYTVLTDGSSPGLHNTRLYLGDLSGRETGYKGSTQISVTVYEWTKGYVWTVDMLSVASPLGYLRAKVPRLYPADSVVQIYGSACTKCYYLPTQTTKKLTMGQQYNIEVGGPRIYYVTGLSTGTRYFVQVKAVNSIGYSRATIAPTAQTPTRHPNGPANVKVSTLTISSTPINSATVAWQKPADNGGLPVTGYKVEWWRGASRPEIQTIELKWVTQPTVAPFKLAFGGVTMATALSMDVTAENLRFALMSLISGSNIPVGHIKVTRVAVNIVQGYQWTVTFDNTNKNAGNQPLIQFIQDPLAITGGSGVFGRVFEVQPGIALPAGNVFPGKQEVQVLVTYATTAVGGYFRLSYKGSTWTNFLSATVSAADFKLALEALPTIGVVTVNSETTQLSGNPWFGRVWTITFESNVGNLAPLIVDSSKITPTGAFVGIKDGDNAVDSTGVLSLWGATSEAAVEYGYYETLDAGTLSYTISNLTPGLSYLVSVSAKNAQGLSTRTQSSPVSIIPPLQVPGPPVNVSVDVNPGASTQLLSSWTAPASDGGSPVWMYRVEYDVSSLFTDREQQEEWCPVALTPAIWNIQSKRLTGTDSISNGYFKLKLTGKNAVEVSDPIPWNAVALAKDEASSVTSSTSGVFCTSASPTCTSSNIFPFDQLEKSGSMQSKLEQFTQLTKGIDVTRSTQAADGGYTWMVTFLDGGQDFLLSVVDMNLACTVALASCTATYDVVVSNPRPGVMPSNCLGNHVIPDVGALNKGQLYYVRVFAYNQVGFGEPKLAAAPQKPMIAPGAPTGVTLAVWTVSELVVLFNPPGDDGGDTVTGYELQWATDTAFTSPSSAVVQLTIGMSAPYRRIISALTKGTRYYARVRARNSQGFGQFQVSSPASQQPYTTPSSPTQVVLGVTSATMLTVGWAPPLDDGGDAVSGYVVQWDLSPSFDSLAVAASTSAVINDATQRSYTITLLTPGTSYYVRVFANNLGGKGTPQISTLASMVPATTRPGRPNSLAVVSTATIGQLQSCPVLNGLDMVYGGVSLESYLVQYADASDFSLAKEVSVTTTSTIISGLDSGKPYYVRVLTVNSQGLNSDFCVRANAQSLLCPDHLVLEDGSVVTGDFVSAAPK